MQADELDDGYRYWDRKTILENLAKNGTVAVGGPRTMANVEQLVAEELVEIIRREGPLVKVQLTEPGRMYMALMRGS